MKQLILTTFMAILILYPAAEAQVNNSPLEQRAKDVMGLFRNNPGNYEQYFASYFLSQVPAEKLTNYFTNIFSNLGRCIKIEPNVIDSRFSGKFNFIFEKNLEHAGKYYS